MNQVEPEKIRSVVMDNAYISMTLYQLPVLVAVQVAV